MKILSNTASTSAPSQAPTTTVIVGRSANSACCGFRRQLHEEFVKALAREEHCDDSACEDGITASTTEANIRSLTIPVRRELNFLERSIFDSPDFPTLGGRRPDQRWPPTGDLRQERDSSQTRVCAETGSNNRIGCFCNAITTVRVALVGQGCISIVLKLEQPYMMLLHCNNYGASSICWPRLHFDNSTSNFEIRTPK